MSVNPKSTAPFDRLRAAYTADNGPLAIDIIDTFPVQCWFGGQPGELQDILSWLPKDAQQVSPFVRYVGAFFAGESIEHVSAVNTPRRHAPAREECSPSWDQAMRSISYRLTGDLRNAEAQLPERDVTGAGTAAGGVGSPANAVRGTLLRIHRGTTLLLLCEFDAARKEFVGVHGTQLPAELQVLRRDALLKSALIEALYGDQRAARGHLRFAQEVPRTDSWLEPQLDAVTVLAQALVAEREDRGAMLRVLVEYPLQSFGELWPFAVLGVQRLYDQLGRWAEYGAKLELFFASAPPHIDGNGIPGSALHISQAMMFVMRGDVARSREAIASADQELLLTKRVHAMLQMSSGAVDLALRYALEFRPATRSLRQFEIWRLALEVSALLALDEPDDVKLMLSVLLTEMSGLNEDERRVFPAEVHEFAEQCGLSWPEVTEGHPPFAVAPQFPTVVLSERERQVLSQVVLGRSRLEAAQALFVSENTVKTHLSSLHKKLGVMNRAQLIAEARLHGLV